jgi:hypothetical protein
MIIELRIIPLLFIVQFFSAVAIQAQCPENSVFDYLSDNLILNGSFESGDKLFETDLDYFGDCQNSTNIQVPEEYSITTNNGTPADCNKYWTPNLTASGGGSFLISDFPENDLHKAIWVQKIEVKPNYTYEFSGDFANVLNELYDNADPTFRVFVDGNVSAPGVIYKSASEIALTEGSGWINVSTSFDVGDNNVIKLYIQNTVTGHNGLDLATDNLSLKIVECKEAEPGDDDTTANLESDFYDCDENVDNFSASVLNGGFEEGSFSLWTNGATNYGVSQIDNWAVASYGNNIDLLATGHGGVFAYEGEVYAEANAFDESSIYQDIATVPGDILHYSFAHRGRDGTDMIGVFMGKPRPQPQEPASNELVNTYTTNNDRWIMYEGKYEVPAGQTVTRFSLKAMKSSSGTLTRGNFIDAVTVQSIHASCLNPMRGNVEICSNGIDDDNDGLIDAADPDCGTSGGNNGGLESNGRLADKIFERTLNRRIEPTIIKNKKDDMIQKKKTAAYGIFNQGLERSALSIEAFIPIDTLANTETFISSPTDLEAITNATEVFSVDIFNGNNRLAAIFATATENGVYEHTKYICDRLKGGRINDLKSERIGFADFVVADMVQPEGNREYAISFSARETKEGKFDIHSHWSLEKYPSDENYYNFQIWASDMDDLKKLTLKTLQLLNEYKQIATMTTTTAPSVFVSQGEYSNGVLDLKIINKKASKSITLEGEKSPTETMLKEYVNETAPIEGHYSEFVSIEIGSVYDMGFRVKHDNDDIFDDLFIADGLWFIDTKGGNINYEVLPSSDLVTSDNYPLERSIEVNGTYENTLNIYRSLKPNFRSVDVSAYNTLHFEVSGAQAMQIVLIKNSVSDWDAQYKTSITTTGASNEINIPLSRFNNGTEEAIELNDIQAIIFKIENNGKIQNFEMEISSLEFRNEEDKMNETAFTNTDILIAPNPAIDNVTIQWTSTEEGLHKAALIDLDGRTIREFEGLTSRGFNQIQLERQDLSEGLYFFSIIEQSGKILTEKIVFIE